MQTEALNAAVRAECQYSDMKYRPSPCYVTTSLLTFTLERRACFFWLILRMTCEGEAPAASASGTNPRTENVTARTLQGIWLFFYAPSGAP